MSNIPEYLQIIRHEPTSGTCAIEVAFPDGKKRVPQGFISESALADLRDALASGRLTTMTFDEHPFEIASIDRAADGGAAVIRIARATPIAARIDTGRIGEVLVELELLRQGWHISRLDSTTFAANGDLIAVRGNAMHVVQVKATKEPAVYFGTTAPFLKDGKPFFNRAPSPIRATALVAVAESLGQPKYFVFSIAQAEALAQSEVTAYHQKLLSMGKSFEKGQCKIPVASASLAPFRDAWHLLDGDQTSTSPASNSAASPRQR